METPDPNPMPEINLGFVDKAREIGQHLVGLCSYFPPNPETAYPSEYRRIETDEPELGGYAEGADQLRLPFANATKQEGWDSLGNYIVKSEYEG